MANSYVEYTATGTGTNQLGQATFSYTLIDVLNGNDIKAFGEASNGTKTELTISSRDTSAKTITLSSAPSSYAKLRVYRQTTSDALVDFVDGARLTESDLDTAYKQGLFVAQEVSEDAGRIGTTSTTNLSLSGTTTVDNLTATGTVVIPSGTDATHFYSEGTWTPAFNGLGTSGSTINFAEFTKIGRVVHFICHVTFVSNTDTSPIQITGLPYSGNNNKVQVLPSPFTSYTANTLIPYVQDTTIFVAKGDSTTDASYQDLSNKYLRISGSYQIL